MADSDLDQAIRLVDEDHDLLDGQGAALDAALEELREGFDADRAVETLEALRRFFVTDLLPHLEEEERELFPLIERELPGGAHHVGRLRGEHQTLRDYIERFRSELTLAGFVNEESEEASLWKVVALGRQLRQRLQSHSRTEDRVLSRLRECLAAEPVGR